MTAIAIYQDRELNLSALSPADYEAIKALHGTIHRGDRILLCKRPSGDREMHVFRSPNGAYFARHFHGGAHGDHRIARVSDEHLRGTECWLNAWLEAGFPTATEVSTDNKVRLDALAFGRHLTALETQVTAQAAARVRGRHTQRLHARALTGAHARDLAEPLRVIWFAPVGRPEWLYRVPSVACRNRSWETTPAPHSVPAIGVRSVDIEPCKSPWFDRCPETGRIWCGRHHVWTGLRGGLSVADIAALVPEGQLIPLDIPGRGVYLVDPASRERYQDFTGHAAQIPVPEKRPEVKREIRGAECDWTGHSIPGNALGPWAQCARCKRRYRPTSPAGLCYDCDRLSRYGKGA